MEETVLVNIYIAVMLAVAALAILFRASKFEKASLVVGRVATTLVRVFFAGFVVYLFREGQQKNAYAFMSILGFFWVDGWWIRRHNRRMRQNETSGE